jgi:uncharacterized protein DUF6990
MNTNEVAKNFKALGWKAKINIDRYAQMELEDRIVEIVFKVKNLVTYQTFETCHSISTYAFTEAVKKIDGGESNSILKVDFKNELRFKENKITGEHVKIACETALNWAKSVDIEQRYQELRELDPSTPGAAGSWHLAALALAGDAEKIKMYQTRFENGDRCGFVIYITKDYIDRALVLAQYGVVR